MHIHSARRCSWARQPSGSSRRPTNGFAILWALAIIAIITTVFALATPVMVQASDRSKVERTYAMLAHLDTGIVTFGSVIRRSGNKYPGRIHELSTIVGFSDDVSCHNQTFNNTSAGDWASKGGPFITIYADPNGLFTPLGALRDSIEHDAGNQPMYLRIPGVNAGLMSMMDQYVDGGDGGTSGTIRFDAASNGMMDLVYQVGLLPGLGLSNHC